MRLRFNDPSFWLTLRGDLLIKLFIFDYGRTLFDRENNRFFDDATPVLKQLATQYKLAIVSYSKPIEVVARNRQLQRAQLYELFHKIIFCDSPQAKDDSYANVISQLAVSVQDTAIVDDHIIRGVAWGNRNGATTYWFKNGKFSSVGPTAETGTPSYTIKKLNDILATLWKAQRLPKDFLYRIPNIRQQTESTHSHYGRQNT